MIPSSFCVLQANKNGYSSSRPYICINILNRKWENAFVLVFPAKVRRVTLIGPPQAISELITVARGRKCTDWLNLSHVLPHLSQEGNPFPDITQTETESCREEGWNDCWGDGIDIHYTTPISALRKQCSTDPICGVQTLSAVRGHTISGSCNLLRSLPVY